MTDVHYISLASVCRRMKSGELSSAHVTQSLLTRIAVVDGELGSFVRVFADQAMESARALDAKRDAGEPLGMLHGVPVAVKDLLMTKGIPTGCGTKVLENWVPDEDAEVVTRLKQAGAVIIGKVKLTEGAFSTHHPEIPAPLNPWGSDRWTGVSSSGSGVSVAAGLAYGALGTDTGGSIRFPSAACGVVGIKATYGRVSRHGAFPLAESLDHIGPMTRCVEDAARMLQVLAGHDPKDPTSLRAPVPNYADALQADLAGMTVGIDRAYATEGVADEVAQAIERALKILKDAGARVEEVTLPEVEALVAGWMLVTGAEAALAHAEHFPSQKDLYGPDLSRLLELGGQASATDYAAVQRAKEKFAAGLVDLFARIDVLVAPALPVPVPSLQYLADARGREDTANFMKFTAPWDFSGSPTITIPATIGEEGVPIAFQLIGGQLEESKIIRAAYAFERGRGELAHPRE